MVESAELATIPSVKTCKCDQIPLFLGGRINGATLYTQSNLVFEAHDWSACAKGKAKMTKTGED